MKKVRKSEVVLATQRLFQNSEDFQTFLAYLVYRHGFTRRTTLEESSEKTAFNEGRRSVLVEIGVLQDLDPVAVKDLEDMENMKGEGVTHDLSV